MCLFVSETEIAFLEISVLSKGVHDLTIVVVGFGRCGLRMAFAWKNKVMSVWSSRKIKSKFDVNIQSAATYILVEPKWLSPVH